VCCIDDREAESRDNEKYEESQSLDLKVILVETVTVILRLLPLLEPFIFYFLPVGIIQFFRNDVEAGIVTRSFY
jgi:hypothetical protein